MDHHQSSQAPVAKRRRLANEHDEVQWSSPYSVPEDSSRLLSTGLAPLSFTQPPYHYNTGDNWGSNATTEPIINHNPGNNSLCQWQYGLLRSSTNGQGMSTEYSGVMRNYWEDFHVRPNPESTYSFHVAETAHLNSAYATSPWSQLNITQPPHATSNTLLFGEDTSYLRYLQNDPIVHHDTFQVPGSSVPEQLGKHPDCSDYSRVQSLSGLEFELPGKEIVCFGMVSSIPARCYRLKAVSIPQQFLAEISLSEDDQPTFRGTEDSIDIKGRIFSHYAQMIHGILGEASLRLKVTCTLELDRSSKALDQTRSQKQCLLDIILHGPVELFEEIGSYFEGYEVFLQDPVQRGDQNLRYCNPHRLSSQDLSSCSMLSDFLLRASRLSGFEEMPQGPELLDVLSSHDELEEHPQPRAIHTSLKKHQRQALTFMRRREQGWAFDSATKDIWKATDDQFGLVFTNRVTRTQQRNEPPPFRGGVIADPMGLGKTLTMIALVAADRDESLAMAAGVRHAKSGDRQSGTTLIVVPPPLLGSWEEQIREHTNGDMLTFQIHHGKSKLTNAQETSNLNIVITTYQTVSAEWREGHQERISVLFSKCWDRLILDEAHFIRNERSRMSRAVCDIEAIARWAVTGTPVQNRLDDLASLLKFIKAYPYDDTKQFKTHISALWKSGEDESAIERLKYLSSCLLLRRPKATISLPTRHDLLCPIDFRNDEKELYDKTRQQTIVSIDEALHHFSESSFHGGFVNVLQQIESLRLLCNLGLRYHSRHAKTDNDTKREDTPWTSIAQQIFNCQREMNSIVCMECSSTIGLAEAVLNDYIDSRKSPRFFRCFKFCCAECYSHLYDSNQNIRCGHSPCCPDASVSLGDDTLEGHPQLDIQQPQIGLSMPSKVEALVNDIRRLPRDEKCIVFSTWRLTLELIEDGLKKAFVPCVRFDGKVPQKDRQTVVERFRKDPTVRVMLLTLSCGAVGLTLTAASRAYLMEPHWNPTLEEQALARIHRLGQTREVTTVRLFIRNSIEEQVMKLQASKNQLAGVILSPHDADKARNNLENLYHLRSLL